MPASLLASQLATLEPPTPDEGAITVSNEQPVDQIVETVLRSHARPGGTGGKAVGRLTRSTAPPSPGAVLRRT